MDERWWEVFADPQLSALSRRALTDNLDLQLASARLQQSRAVRQVITAERYPNTAATTHARMMPTTKVRIGWMEPIMSSIASLTSRS